MLGVCSGLQAAVSNRDTKNEGSRKGKEGNGRNCGRKVWEKRNRGEKRDQWIIE